MKSKYRYRGIFQLITAVSTILLLAMLLRVEDTMHPRGIEITGNKYLETEEYLKFAELNRINTDQNISLKIIKDRVAKHPYVSSVNVHWDENDVVEINISEKEFYLIMLSSNKQFLISNDLEIIPLLQYTKNANYPIINNPAGGQNIKAFGNLKAEKELLKGIKIVSIIKMVDEELYSTLSEIDLTEDDITRLFFSKFGYQILLGDNQEIEKIISLAGLLRHIENRGLMNHIEYIDMRFNDKIFVGTSGLTSENGGTKI